MAHLYRAEMNRMTVWRQRLDITSNWAIILTTALTTFTLGSEDVPHYSLLLLLALIGISIVIEARRYRHLLPQQVAPVSHRVRVLRRAVAPVEPATIRGLASAARRRPPPRPLHHRLVHRHARSSPPQLPTADLLRHRGVVRQAVHPSATRDRLRALLEHLSVGGFIPSWFVAVTALLFIGGSTALAITCPPAESLEDWSGHYTRIHGRRTPVAEVPPVD